MKESPITGISKLQSWDQSGPFACVCTDSIFKKYFYMVFKNQKNDILWGKMKFSSQCPEK